MKNIKTYEGFFDIFKNEKTDYNEILLGDNKIYKVKKGDKLVFMEHYKNYLLKKDPSLSDKINLDDPVTFIQIESSDLIRPNLIVQDIDGVDWVFGSDAFMLDKNINNDENN